MQNNNTVDNSLNREEQMDKYKMQRKGKQKVMQLLKFFSLLF